jgi:patatin-like phospholipase/acyl hydrolase
MGYFNILSLDGGGIRGLLSCKLLERLERLYPGYLEKVNLFAGTSTGGILALGLAAGLSPAEIGDLYQKDGTKIFSKNIWDKVGDIDRFYYADYKNNALEEALKNKFGGLRLGDLKKKVLISSFRLDSGSVTKMGVRSWKPKFFQNFDDDPSDCDQTVVDVALRTSAAPTYFPVYQGFADGGLVANNPSMCAVAQALDKNTGKQKLNKITLLSIGTGVLPKFVKGFNENWGYLQWAPHLITIMIDGVSGVADYQCRQLLGPRYLRLDVLFDRDIGLDNVDEMSYLVQLADREEINETQKWFSNYYGDRAPA